MINGDIFEIVENWFAKNSDYWTKKGFKINKEQPTTGRPKNSITIDVEKGTIDSSITIYDTGECDFLQVEIPSNEDQKYFKNVILTGKEQADWELNNYFYNFDSLKGSSIDPYHNPDGID